VMPSKKACQGQPFQLSFGDDEISFIIWVPEAGVPRRTQGARLRYHCMRTPENIEIFVQHLRIPRNGNACSKF
jgi:hypothetical protein